jgi:hypothetical protein
MYIISEGTERYKIGQSDDVENRLRQIQVGNSRELKILVSTDIITEVKMHEMFDKFRIKGEWFLIQDDIMQKIIDVVNIFNSLELTVKKAIKFTPRMLKTEVKVWNGDPDARRLVSYLEKVNEWPLKRRIIYRKFGWNEMKVDAIMNIISKQENYMDCVSGKRRYICKNYNKDIVHCINCIDYCNLVVKEKLNIFNPERNNSF